VGQLMKIYIEFVDDQGNKIGTGLLAESGVVDKSGNVYTEEALRNAFDRLEGCELRVVDRTD